MLVFSTHNDQRSSLTSPNRLQQSHEHFEYTHAKALGYWLNMAKASSEESTPVAITARQGEAPHLTLEQGGINTLCSKFGVREQRPDHD